MQAWFPERTSFLPSWARIALRSFALVTGILMLALDFHKFGWISPPNRVLSGSLEPGPDLNSGNR